MSPPRELRERGIYLLPPMFGRGEVEVIAFPSENPNGGYILYDRLEWFSGVVAGLEADADGNLTWCGDRARAKNLTTAILTDTGRTQPEEVA